MLQTSIIVELLRSQPRLTFWFMALTQTVLWWVFPSLFFSSPPGELPVVLAVGHEYQLGSYFGPPLAFWLADIAFVIGGATAVYLLAQVCVLVMLWAVFTLGRAVVGIHHAAFAVLLMVGIAAFSAPTPNFGPSVLAMPLVALSLLSLWRAVGEQRRVSWFVLGLELGLLILTTYAGLILLALIMVFLAATRRGRSAMRSVEPWLASVLIAVVLFPHLMWLDRSNGLAALGLRPLQGENAPVAVLKDWLSLFEAILIAHIGLAILVALGSKWHLRTDEKVPVFVRSFTDPFARLFVYFFAIAPGLVAVTVAAILGERSPVGGIAPHLVLSGLAIIMLAGNAIPWHRPRMVGAAWVLLLFAPPLVAAAGILLLPWTGWSSTDVSRPAKAMGQYFSDSFQRRTGSTAAHRQRRDASCRPRRDGLAAATEPLFLREPGAVALGHHGGPPQQGPRPGLAGRRERDLGAGQHRAALPRPRRRGAARLRAPGAGAAAADPHRLGDAAPGIGTTDGASAGGRGEAGSSGAVRAGSQRRSPKQPRKRSHDPHSEIELSFRGRR